MNAKVAWKAAVIDSGELCTRYNVDFYYKTNKIDGV